MSKNFSTGRKTNIQLDQTLKTKVHCHEAPYIGQNVGDVTSVKNCGMQRETAFLQTNIADRKQDDLFNVFF